MTTPQRMRIQMLVDQLYCKQQRHIEELACVHDAKVEHPVELHVDDPPFMDARATCYPRDLVEEFEDFLGHGRSGLMASPFTVWKGGHHAYRRRKVR